MAFNVAILKAMQSEGLDLDACIRVLEAGEKKTDPTATERKRRQRAKSRRDVTRDPPNDNNLTPEVSEANASSPQPWACPVGVEREVWDDLLTNRKRKRQPNTPTAWKRFQDDLTRVSATTGIPPPRLIEHAAAKGWAGIYDPTKDQGNGQQSGLGKTSAAMLALGTFGDDRPM